MATCEWLVISRSTGTSGTTWSAGQTRYATLNGGTVSFSAENGISYLASDNFLFHNMALYIASNTNTVDMVYTFRKNTAPGNQTITVPTTLTGLFEDTVNSDSVVAGDLICYQTAAAAGSGSTNTMYVSFLCRATDGTFPLIGAAQVSINFGQTVYGSVEGVLLGLATETYAQLKTYNPMTLSKLRAKASANTLDGATTITMRKNGVSVNQTVSIPASSQGIVIDVTDSDSFVSGDLISTIIVSGGSTGTIALSYVATQALATVKPEFSSSSTSLAHQTWFCPIGGGNFYTTVEASTQTKSRATVILDHLYVYTDTYTLNANSTISARVNGVTNLSLAVLVTGSGTFEDTTDQITILPQDQINYNVLAGGSSGAMTIRTISINVNQIPQIQPVGGLQSESTVSILKWDVVAY